MFNQHAKWLKACHKLPWRKPIASLNYLLTSHVWRQDHNGFSHQDPGFIDHVANKKADTVRIYLPPDANMSALRRRPLPPLAQLRQPHHRRQTAAPQWLNIEAAVQHCIAGVGEWEWASNSDDPEVVMACAGDVPTLETMAAVTVLRDWAPDLRLRVVNVVDLFTLETFDQHPHGIEHEAFDRLFTVDKPVIFAFHGYPTVVHKLTYKRHNHSGFHIHGYKEEGTTTTPFDMTVLNGLDRYTLALDALKYVPSLQASLPGVPPAPLRDDAADTNSTSPSTAKTCPKSGTGNGQRKRLRRKNSPTLEVNPAQTVRILRICASASLDIGA